MAISATYRPQDSRLSSTHGPSGVRVNVICPGFIETPMFDSVMGMLGFEAPRKALRHEHKLRRFGRAREIASVATMA